MLRQVLAQWIVIIFTEMSRKLALGIVLTVLSSITISSPALAHEDITPLVSRLKQSVVNIEVHRSVNKQQQIPNILPKNTPLWQFFEEFYSTPDNQQQGPRGPFAIGSGFITSDDGYIVTNHHVIEGGEDIIVELNNNKRYKADIIGTDKISDIALLKIDANDLIAVPFGDSEKASEGETVIAIGNPLGLGFSVSMGIISSRYRNLGGMYDDYIQTDAAINFGNSGGPLFNLDGEVIGVNTSIATGQSGVNSSGSIGIAFSMSSVVVKGVVEDLLEYGSVRRGWLGISMQKITDDIAEGLGLDDTHGILISHVFPSSPAERDGLMRGDIILALNGKSVGELKKFQHMILDIGPQNAITLRVRRNDEMIDIPVKLALLQDNTKNVDYIQDSNISDDSVLGMGLSNITREIIEKYNLPENIEGVVIVAVDPGSQAYVKRIRAGNIIIEIDRKPVSSHYDANKIIDEARNNGKTNVLILLSRISSLEYLTLDLN